jgi:hypothetical protein
MGYAFLGVAAAEKFNGGNAKARWETRSGWQPSRSAADSWKTRGNEE